MAKRLAALALIALTATPAAAATYVILPSPGSMEPATILVTAKQKAFAGPVFVCHSVEQIGAGTCRPQQQRHRR